MDKIADLQKYVARVESREGKTWGTAFILHRNGLLVTCAHVLSKNGMEPGEWVNLRFVVDWNKPHLARVLEDGWSPGEPDDIAFLKVANLPEGALVAPLLEWRGFGRDDNPVPLLACGFPLDKDKEIVADGKIVQFRLGLENNPELLLDAKNVKNGMSGGPVWDSRPGMNGVLGMVRQVYIGPEMEDLAKATPVETILRHLPASWHVTTQEAKAVREHHVAVIRKFEYLDLRDASWLGELRLPLDNLYVKLQAIGELPPRDVPFNVEMLKTRGVVAKEKGKSPQDDSNLQGMFYASPKLPPPPVPVETALNDSPHLVVLGEPGSGKSTLLHYLALQFAQEEAVTRLKLKTGGLPLYLRLIEYAPHAQNDSLSRYLVKKLTDQLPAYLLADYLQDGQCILLLDALDEVGERLRRGVADRIDEFLNSPAYGKNRVVMTSRIAGYHTVKLQAQSIRHYTLCPFQPAEAHEFAEKWFQAVISGRQQVNVNTEVERVTSGFMTDIKQPGLDRLMDNPLLLRIAAALYVGGVDTLSGVLPTRVSLYGRYVDQLLKHRDKAKGIEPFWPNEEKARVALQEIAWAMHVAQAPLSNRQLALTLDKQLGSEAEEFLLRLRERTGLLIAYAPSDSAEPDESLLAFSHLTFREYFVARYLFQKWQDDFEAAWQVICPIRHQPEMRYPLLLLAGLFGFDRKDGTLFIQKLWHANEEESDELAKQVEDILRRDLLLAGWSLIEMGRAQVDERIYQAYVEELLQTWDNQLFIRLRNEIMNIIGRVCNVEFKEKLAAHLVDLLVNEEYHGISYDLHNAAMGGLGRLGIVNNRVLDSILGILPVFYNEGPMVNRDTDWLNRLAAQRDEDLSPLARFQKSAIESLVLLDVTTPDIIDGLVDAVKLPSSIVREAAAKALQHFSKTNPEIISKLLNTLDEYYQATRYFVAEQLVQMAETNPVVIDALIKLATNRTETWQKRELAVKSLGDLIEKTKGAVSSEVYEALVDILEYNDEDIPVVGEAIKALGKGLPSDNFPLSLKILRALISFFVMLDREKVFMQRIGNQSVDSVVAGTLIELLIQDTPYWTLYKAQLHPYSLLSLMTSGSVVWQTLILFIQMLYEQNPEVSWLIADGFCEGLMGLPVLQVKPENILASLRALTKILQKPSQSGLFDVTLEAKWQHIRAELGPLTRQLHSREEDALRQIISQIFGNATIEIRHRDGVTHEPLIEQATASTQALEMLIMCFLMTGFNLVPEVSKKYQKDVDQAIITWGRYPPSSEVIDELCSIATVNSGADRKVIAIRLLSQLKSPPPKVKDTLVNLLSSKDYKVKRVAAEAVGNLNYTEPAVIEALMNPENFFSSNIWYSYVEESFAKSLGKLAHKYKDIDKVIEVLIAAAIFAPGASLAAVEGLGQLGYVTPPVILALIKATSDLNQNVRQSAISGLIRLAEIDKGFIIASLIAFCKNFDDYFHPYLTSLQFAMKAQELGRAAVFTPYHFPDIHNYAYDALWSVMKGEVVRSE